MYEYRAKILEVYDGDGAFESVIDLGMNISLAKKIRLYGVDTPEMRGNQHDAAKIVRDFVRTLILNKYVKIKTKKDKTGKYGRLLAEVFYQEEDNEEYRSLAEILLEKNFAKEYFGGTKEIWTEDELEFIKNSINE